MHRVTSLEKSLCTFESPTAPTEDASGTSAGPAVGLARDPVVVAISGAAGQIGYSLLPLICSGQLYGPQRLVSLRLLDIPQSMEVLRGVVMELEDAAYPLLANIYVTADPTEALDNADAVILLGGFPRRPGMERADLIGKNTSIFSALGPALEQHAKKDVKIVVVANPANTNCLTLMRHAPSIAPENFSALMRLDHNRAAALTARQVNLILRGDRPGRGQGAIEDSSRISATDVRNVIVWGNHSARQYPDLSHSVVTLRTHRAAPARSILPSEWIEADFVAQVQHRGAKVMEARKMSSALSAAHAGEQGAGRVAASAQAALARSADKHAPHCDRCAQSPVICGIGCLAHPWERWYPWLW
jgi:malate dehydrogenase|eukprot:SAG25_NODE_1792_length_2326_cov_1.026493_1_plen_359_part_00